MVIPLSLQSLEKEVSCNFTNLKKIKEIQINSQGGLGGSVLKVTNRLKNQIEQK